MGLGRLVEFRQHAQLAREAGPPVVLGHVAKGTIQRGVLSVLGRAFDRVHHEQVELVGFFVGCPAGRDEAAPLLIEPDNLLARLVGGSRGGAELLERHLRKDGVRREFLPGTEEAVEALSDVFADHRCSALKSPP